MVRHAAGVNAVVGDCFLAIREMICTKPVRKKDTNINGSAWEYLSTGKAQSKAIQSLTSPAPIQPPAQADNKAKLASHKSK